MVSILLRGQRRNQSAGTRYGGRYALGDLRDGERVVVALGQVARPASGLDVAAAVGAAGEDAIGFHGGKGENRAALEHAHAGLARNGALAGVLPLGLREEPGLARTPTRSAPALVAACSVVRGAVAFHEVSLPAGLHFRNTRGQVS